MKLSSILLAVSFVGAVAILLLPGETPVRLAALTIGSAALIGSMITYRRGH